jgi:hypothetical protein
MTTRREMLLDRDLSLDLFEVAFRIASSPEPWVTKRRLLTVALRDYVSNQEAEGKTKKCLTRVWLNPPLEAAPMINWALAFGPCMGDRRVLHLGALLATFSFAGTVSSVIGRSLSLSGNVLASDVRRRTREVWGDKPSVDIAARKVYTSMKSLGVLSGGGRDVLRAGEKLSVSATLTPWLIHALLLTRGVESIPASGIRSAPELFWADPSTFVTDEYPLLKRHNEGGSRVIWAAT